MLRKKAKAGKKHYEMKCLWTILYTKDYERLWMTLYDSGRL